MAAYNYASNTSVKVEKSRAELDSLLGKHGASQRGIMTDEQTHRAIVMFVLSGHSYRMEVPLPAKPLRATPREEKKWEQAQRARWRAVVLLLKAKLELVKLGVSTIEHEFLASMVLPGGKTVGDKIASQITEMLKGAPPRLLGEPGGKT